MGITFFKGKEKSKHLFAHWEALKDLLKAAELLLFLDYDGTLTPIMPRPEEAILNEDTRQIIAGLSKDSRCKVSIVTGRALPEIRKLVGVKDVTYVGNHGFEVEGPDVYFKSAYFPQTRAIFEKIMKDLKGRFKDLPGVILEDKGMTLSVHYRQVDERRQPWFERNFQKVVKPFLKERAVKIYKGKKVFEIRPPIAWDKGEAVMWLLREHREALEDKREIAIYIGDDRTDEDAFAALQGTAITVYVGKGKRSKAKYYLDDTAQVKELLAIIYFLRIA